jgi:N-acetylglucosamine kinase-like BadF-type ATPase
VQSADGRGSDSQLLPRILQRYNLPAPADLPAAIYQSPIDRAAIASLAELVLAAARDGDDAAREIVTQGVSDLTDMVAALADKLGFDNSPFPLALAGGLLIHNQSLQSSLCSRLESRGLRPQPVACVPEPVWGAVQLAVGDLRS